MRGLALFDHAITTGETSSASLARERFRRTAEVARDLNAVSHWWTAYKSGGFSISGFPLVSGCAGWFQIAINTSFEE
jgi:hypothetical protein